MCIFRNGLVYTGILFLVFTGCNSSNFLLPEGRSVPLAVKTVTAGQLLKQNDTIPLTIRSDRLRTVPDMVRVSLQDSKSTPVTSSVFEGRDLVFPLFPDIVLGDLELSEDAYSLVVELFQGEEEIGVHTSWFFYSDSDVTLGDITVNPHSVQIGEIVEVILELQGKEEPSPYVQFRMNGEVVYQDQVIQNRVQFDLQVPDTPGIYDLRLDMYPWFDDRITETMESSNQHSVELLVLSESVLPENNEEHRITESENVSIDENFLYYDNEELFFSVSIEELPVPTSEDLFFTIGDGNFMLTLNRSETVLGFRIHHDNAQYEYNIETTNKLQEITVTCLEGEDHFTLIIFQEDRLLYGDVIPFDRFSELETGDDLSVDYINGVRTGAVSLGEITIVPVDDQQESIYKQILQDRHGNFLLYAEGFEFPLSETSTITFSENVRMEQGYLVLLPESWVQLPPFALDEYTVSVETIFHQNDDLESLSISLLQQNDEAQEELFTLSGKGVLRFDDTLALSDVKLDTRFTFVLSRKENQVTLNIQDNDLLFPVLQDGFFRLYLNQNDASDEDSDVRIRINSVSATNEVDELVDRVLDTLP